MSLNSARGRGPSRLSQLALVAVVSNFSGSALARSELSERGGAKPLPHWLQRERARVHDVTSLERGWLPDFEGVRRGERKKHIDAAEQLLKLGVDKKLILRASRDPAFAYSLHLAAMRTSDSMLGKRTDNTSVDELLKRQGSRAPDGRHNQKMEGLEDAMTDALRDDETRAQVLALFDTIAEPTRRGTLQYEFYQVALRSIDRSEGFLSQLSERLDRLEALQPRHRRR